MNHDDLAEVVYDLVDIDSSGAPISELRMYLNGRMSTT